MDIWFYAELPKNQVQPREIKTSKELLTMITTTTNPTNWLLQSDLLAKSGLTELTCGKDCGAGYGKGIYGDFPIMMPAAYSLVRNRDRTHHKTIAKDGCWVKYVEGSRMDLKDIQFFWGSAAISQTDHILLHDDKGKKAELSLESILSDLAVLNISDGMKLSISLSNHSPERWATEIKRRVEGTHSFEHLHPLTRSVVTKKVEIVVSEVYPEGFGSIAHCLFGEASLMLDPSELAIALDVGSSTWIATVFSGGGSVIARHLIEGGCGQLHSMIAEMLDKRNDKASFLSRDVKHLPSSINQGILDRTFTYGGNASTGKNFEAEYSECLDEWWSSRIEKFANFATNGNYLDRAKHLIAWGGGVSLPVVDQNLAALGFLTLKNPQYINALGLQLLTEISKGA